MWGNILAGSMIQWDSVALSPDIPIAVILQVRMSVINKVWMCVNTHSYLYDVLLPLTHMWFQKEVDSEISEIPSLHFNIYQSQSRYTEKYLYWWIFLYHCKICREMLSVS